MAIRMIGLSLVLALVPAACPQTAWTTFAKSAQHLAASNIPSQPLSNVHWQMRVDLDPQYVDGELLIHYGTPLITSAGTVVVPVKTGAHGGFRVEGHQAAGGTLFWSTPSDYVLPPSHGWTPVFGPALAANRVYMPGAGGTILFRSISGTGAAAVGRLAFYGLPSYYSNPGGFNSTVYINTPLTTDRAGNIYFGFLVSGVSPIANLRSGIARIGAGGQGTWIAATDAASDSTMNEVAYNCAPALSWDGSLVYVAVSNGSIGYLVALDSTTLAPVAHVALKDPQSGLASTIPDDGSSSPTTGPDGDVYYGVLDNPSGTNQGRGWMLHFDATLSQTKTPGAFGWDDTASVVPASAVPSYTGSSDYLLMTKYNNYLFGQYRIAILDPHAGSPSMTVVQSLLAPAGKEWCINSAAVDVAGKAILANNEDGHLYRWDLTTGIISETMDLTGGVGEAYTPTVIGLDGTVYAINNATLFAVGN